MADWLETAELLDVDMDHLAGMLALVAPDRFGRLDIPEPRQPGTLENPADGGGRDADLMGDVLAGQRCRRKATMRSAIDLSVRPVA